MRAAESTDARGSPVFPPEITDKFIDHLHDQPHALSNCNLVSSQWLPRSRLYRFRDVRLKNTSAIAKFSALLPGAPVIGGYIRTLEFGSDCDEHRITWGERDDGTLCYSLCYPKIRIVLAAARELRELRVDGLPLTFFSGVSKSVRSAHLLYVRIGSVRDLAQWICSLAGLRSLALAFLVERGGATLIDSTNHPEEVLTLPPRLDNIRLSFPANETWPSPLSSWLISTDIASQLNTLRIYSVTVDDPMGVVNRSVKQLLRELGASLESLELGLNPHEPGQCFKRGASRYGNVHSHSVKSIDIEDLLQCTFAQCNNLRELRFAELMVVSPTWIYKSRGMHLISQLLKNVQTRSISSVNFVLECYDRDSLPGAYDWLQTALPVLSRDVFHSVSRVVFQLCTWVFGGELGGGYQWEAAYTAAKRLAAIWDAHRRPGLVFEVRFHDPQVADSSALKMFAVSHKTDLLKK